MNAEQKSVLKKLHDDLGAIRKPLFIETYNPDRLKGWGEPGYESCDEDYTPDDYYEDCTRKCTGFIYDLTNVFTPVYTSYDFSAKYKLSLREYKPEPNALLTLLEKNGLEQQYIGDLKKWTEIWNVFHGIKSVYFNDIIRAALPTVKDYSDTVFCRHFSGVHSSHFPTLCKQRCDNMLTYTDNVRKRTFCVLEQIVAPKSKQIQK